MLRQEILSQLFPQASATFDKRGTEVNGLPKDTVPRNCEVVDSGKSYGDILRRQDYFLVRVAGVLVFLRVCTADEQSGYAEYAVIRKVAETPQEQEELIGYARQSIASICRERS
jgi:hypothetical protein